MKRPESRMVAWHRAFDLAVEVFRLTSALDDEETHGLVSRLRGTALRVPALIFDLARTRARLEDRVAHAAELLPQRALVALREHHRLRIDLPARLQLLHARRGLAFGRPGRERFRFGDQRFAFLLCLPARAREFLVQRSERGFQACIELLPCGGLDAAERAFLATTTSVVAWLLIVGAQNGLFTP